jgi:hypothetical protein
VKTFAEWVSEDHPDDDMLNEFLADLAKRAANSKFGRAATLAGALAVGSAGTASAAMPMPPKVTQQAGNSQKPFSKEFAVSIAKEMGVNPSHMEKMSDFDAWYKVMEKVRKLEDEMSRIAKARQRGGMVGNKEFPLWYVKFGTEYGWTAPKAPEVNQGAQR